MKAIVKLIACLRRNGWYSRAMKKKASGKTQKRRAEPERVKVGSDWSAAIRKALAKERPAEGWPEPRKRKGRD